ncbi:chromate transporter [Vagococcus acidifermentans]|uniref:Chromate transporter n=1 Tax=Vagococcus acidifermentans TaxID=564710 RepID=A0A430AWY9_9ENTE|nr:chromate transporter [Vagococcus acidifermentans]RSU12556.1 hypothetical protein CBF27_06170 [Vagococcus acidifermentans]
MIRLIWIFLKIGFLGFGGGYAMLSLIFKDALSLGLTMQQFTDMNTLDLLAPGPIAVNSATYVGYMTFGLVGGLVATLAVCTSSFVCSALFLKYETTIVNNIYLEKMLQYLKIAAVSMIASVAISLLSDSLFSSELPVVSIVSMVTVSLLRFRYKLAVIPSLAVVGMVGCLLYVCGV